MTRPRKRNAASQGNESGASIRKRPGWTIGDYDEGPTAATAAPDSSASDESQQRPLRLIPPGSSFHAERARCVARLMSDTSLLPAERVLGWHIAHVIDPESGFARITQESLAAAVGTGRRWTQTLLKRLVEAGYLYRHRVGRDRRHHEYRLVAWSSA